MIVVASSKQGPLFFRGNDAAPGTGEMIPTSAVASKLSSPSFEDSSFLDELGEYLLLIVSVDDANEG